MSESPYAEVESVLLLVAEACERAGNVARGLAEDGADPHLVEALRDAERELLALRRRLMHRTHVATPVRADAQLRF